MVKNCYCCRTPLVSRFPGYPALCTACGEYHMARLAQKVDLSGYVALVTGARIKIGYQTALRLLRCGAKVVATSRFPYQALEAYSAEPDFPIWKDRLHLQELDLLRVDRLGEWIDRLSCQIPQLDILINNAAQTVKEPAREEQWHQLESRLARKWGHMLPPGQTASPEPAEQAGLPLLFAEPAVMGATENTWVMRSADISLRELLEVQIINVTAPYLLGVGLRPLLTQSPNPNRFIINVSSLEGKFSVRRKSPAHPHTNMAKAALNMMTKTLAGEYKKDRIFLYSIDPGWVSNQFPPGRKKAPAPLPLSPADSAARLTQPVFDWLREPHPPTGIFLKDYRETEW